MGNGAKGEWFVELSVSRARKLALEGKLEEAYDILVGVSGHNTRPTLFNLRTTWRGELLGALRARFPDMNVYPQRLVEGAALKAYSLKSREAYVHELFDGVTTLEDAVALSPVDEVDTLRSVARLIDLGVLSLGKRV
jgi:hypothetical protein